MKRLATIVTSAIIIAIFALGSVQGHGGTYAAIENEDTVKSALVDMVADIIEKRGKGDSTIYLIGNVAFHHNGAIIQCDSARKYSSNSMDFFGHVIINKDSAYIYGDKASYNGQTNLAKVYAPIIKLMRGDASLYTYNLTFNTKTNIGYFSDGGMVIHRDTNHMESMSGEFNSNLSELIFRDKVSLKNPSYTAKSDSMRYDLDRGIITFMTHTTIWTNNQNDILKASRGNILTNSSICNFTKDSYVLSASDEMWADTLSYNSNTKCVTLMSNIQIVDTAHQTIGFGDWGFWDDSTGYAVLTSKPSIISYSADRTDTMYLRADSIIMTTGDSTIIDSDDFQEPLTPDMPKFNTTKDSPAMDTLKGPDSVAMDTIKGPDSLAMGTLKGPDSVAMDTIKGPDSLAMVSDTIAKDSTKRVIKGILPDTTTIDSVMQSIARDTLKTELKEDTTTQTPRVIRGFFNARGWSRDYQFRCDSLVAHTKDSMGTMYGKPVLWTEENQLVAEQIDLYTMNGDLDWADINGKPIIVQKLAPKHPVEADSSRYNQAAGNTMQTYFKNNELDSAVMEGNVHNIYWMDNKGFTAAIVDVQCADLTIFFKDRKLRRMRWNGNVEWKIYPLEKIDKKQPFFLEDFQWLDSIRPKCHEDISTRTIRESVRESVLKEERPAFNIELGILYMMRQLMEEHKWTDRTEDVNYTPEYFKTAM